MLLQVLLPDVDEESVRLVREELRGGGGEEDVVLGGNQLQLGHRHGVDEVAVDDQPDLHGVRGERDNVGESAN